MQLVRGSTQASGLCKSPLVTLRSSQVGESPGKRIRAQIPDAGAPGFKSGLCYLQPTGLTHATEQGLGFLVCKTETTTSNPQTVRIPANSRWNALSTGLGTGKPAVKVTRGTRTTAVHCDSSGLGLPPGPPPAQDLCVQAGTAPRFAGQEPGPQVPAPALPSGPAPAASAQLAAQLKPGSASPGRAVALAGPGGGGAVGEPATASRRNLWKYLCQTRQQSSPSIMFVIAFSVLVQNPSAATSSQNAGKKKKKKIQREMGVSPKGVWKVREDRGGRRTAAGGGVPGPLGSKPI